MRVYPKVSGLSR